MIVYRGIVKNNKIVLKEKKDIKDGSEVIILLKPSEIDDERISKRQIQMIERGFKMGKISYSSRGELYD